MDFGVLGLDGFVGAESNAGTPSHHVAPPETRAKILGSGLAKQERSSSPAQDDWRTTKVHKTNGFYSSETMSLHQPASLLRSTSLLSPDIRHQEHMLSFSSAKTETNAPFLSKESGLVERNSLDQIAFAFHHTPSANNRSSGYGTGSMNTSMHGPFTGVRGPFTPSQWIELEHQALIYKYITANVSVPSNLLIPLKKSLCSYGFTGGSAGSYSHHPLGWGAFHLGYPGNSSDPEPGRCRRTDGKKWRCSRDAVADQKYCERHINRGRHRSRKPVEGQTGHAATGTTNSKVGPMTNSMSTSVITSSGVSSSLVIAQPEFKSSQAPAAKPSPGALVNRAPDPGGVSVVSSTINLRSNESTFAVSKQPLSIDESPKAEFGIVTSDSLLNPSQRTPYLNTRNYESYLNFSDQETQDQHPLLQFMDEWPKDPSSRSFISWPEELKSDWTQLSVSIPSASKDFSLSSSSPTEEKLALSPLRLCREYDSVQMGLGVSCDPTEPSKQKRSNWIPISCGTSMGGPLGEVLSTNTCKAGSYNNPSALNLLTEEVWDGSPKMGCSPTGVLQKSTFGSLSNSSSGGSPGAEGTMHKVCDDVLGSTIVSSSPVPSL